jgi:hypothetical protein
MHGDIAVNVRLWEPVMRQRIIEAITYPRIMLVANLDKEECPQELFFNHAHKACRVCEQGEECRWLNVNDHISVLAIKPIDSLYESLQFCIDYVEAQCRHARHSVRWCACESCDWIRSARRLASDYRQARQTH